MQRKKKEKNRTEKKGKRKEEEEELEKNNLDQELQYKNLIDLLNESMQESFHQEQDEYEDHQRRPVTWFQESDENYRFNYVPNDVKDLLISLLSVKLALT